MKGTRIALMSLLIVLVMVIFFYLDNRTFNQLVHDRRAPTEETMGELQSLSTKNVERDYKSIHISNLYYSGEKKKLYFGIWYRKGIDLLNDRNSKWKEEDGTVQFLVKVVNDQGTTFTGKTAGNTEATFSIFQYVTIEDFKPLGAEEINENGGEGSLTFYFYPILKKSNNPRAQALFEATVTLSP